MRRIIERTVTVVTTTTWTISWQEDALHLDPHANPVADDFPQSDVSHETAKHIQKFSPVTQTKEADISETEKVINQTADEAPNNSYSDQSKKGNEKS
jgi:hypothetical protein